MTTGSSSLAAEIRDFYDLTMLDKAIPELVHTRYAMKKRIPKNSGRTIHWRRSSLLAPATTPLTEGVTPAGAPMTVTDVPVTVGQFGNFVAFSDIVPVTSIDNIMTENAENLGQNAGNTFDLIAAGVYNAGTNVMYANGRVSRGTVAAGDVITDLEIKKMRRGLKRANCRPISSISGYVAIVHPDTFLDLQNTDGFRLTGFYQDKESIHNGSIIKLYDIYFLETTNAMQFAAQGAGGLNVYSTIVFGQNAIATVDIEQLGLETIYKPLGSAGTADPLNQNQTQGWKGTFAAKILNDTWLLRVEHATTA